MSRRFTATIAYTIAAAVTVLYCAAPIGSEDSTDKASGQKQADGTRIDIIDGTVSDKLFKTAQQYIKRHDYQSAIKYLSSCLPVHHDPAKILLERGQCYYYSGFYDKALADFKKAASISPTNTNAYIWQAKVYAGQDQPKAGFEVIKAAAAKAPNDKELSRELTNQYLSNKDYDNALISVQHELKLNPLNREAQDQKAIIPFYIDKNYISKLNTELKSNPKNIDALYYRALAYSRVGNLALAKKDFEKAFKLSPLRAGLKYSLALCLIQSDPASNRALELFTSQIKTPLDYDSMPALQQRLNILENQGKFSIMLSEANNAIAIDKSPTNLWLRHRAFARLERWEEVRKDCLDWLSISPHNESALGALYNCESTLKDYNAALRYAEMLNKQYPGKYLYERGLTYEALGKHKEAIQDFRELIRHDPTNKNAIYYLSSVFINTQRYADALNILSEGLKLYPHDYSLLYQRVGTNSLLKNRQAALRDTEELVQFHPKKTKVLRNATNFCLAHGFLQQAKRYNKKLLQLSPNDTLALIQSISIKLELNQTTEARKELTKLASIKISEPNALVSRGQIFAKMGMKKEALRDFNAAAAQGVAAGFFEKAMLLNELGNKKDALRAVSMACRLSPQNSTIHHSAAVLYLENHRLPEAISSYSNELAISPNNIYALLGRASVYQMLEDGNKALADLNKVIELNPNCSTAYRLRGEVYRYLLNKPDLAAKDFIKFGKLKSAERHLRT